ncbi:ribosome small subunit-dependent GTPase A [Cellulomonas sp. HZM]|uniref:ribosome small subunit-dependent GTPase A n=1 Tax=Cellulomonas sp. HZM TaxID=1454010 RepID=UPI0009DFD793|nr:ribosome small subunit-dependent GTPase A [Cellulomonas sp. HZM]
MPHARGADPGADHVPGADHGDCADTAPGGVRARVVRADRGAVLVVPADDLHAEPRRATLDRDGLAPGPEDERLVPTVGDHVSVRDDHVVAVAARRSALVRDSAGTTSREQVLAAGVDVVLVVEHLDPDPDLGRVERLLTLAWRSGARPVVVLTKADLVPDAAGMAAEVADVAPAVDVHAVSVARDEGLEPLRALVCPGATLVVVGPSGAGKSTLVNALAGCEVMATGERRDADGRGRHTTTHRELVALPGGACLIDTPGIRGIGLVADDDALEHTFSDVVALAGTCRFADCEHRGEPGCAVLAAIAAGDLPQRRLDSWRKLAREAAYQARRVDSRLAAQERARWKQVTKEYQRGMRGPGRPRT